ncbi:hypothetical protein [Clostridium thermarum]|uniref:hypothetical protein n=1 Tax=Clostridium thermarum TaxID=1716543 RepID=UPI0011227027|nr:hypothetical protein [Clostridium thermarum]
MKAVYIVMSQTGTWLSKMIKLYTKLSYNHISLSLDESLSTMYSFGRVNPINPFSGGFVLENINEGVYKIFPECRCIIYKLEITDEQYNRLQQLLKDFEVNRHKLRYNFLGLLYVVLKLDKYRKNHYFCSQFVSEVMQKSGIVQFDKPSNLVTVKDFMKISFMYPVFEGYTNQIFKSVIV